MSQKCDKCTTLLLVPSVKSHTLSLLHCVTKMRQVSKPVIGAFRLRLSRIFSFTVALCRKNATSVQPCYWSLRFSRILVHCGVVSRVSASLRCFHVSPATVVVYDGSTAFSDSLMFLLHQRHRSQKPSLPDRKKSIRTRLQADTSRNLGEKLKECQCSMSCVLYVLYTLYMFSIL